jgi:hypothetical protein
MKRSTEDNNLINGFLKGRHSKINGITMFVLLSCTFGLGFIQATFADDGGHDPIPYCEMTGGSSAWRDTISTVTVTVTAYKDLNPDYTASEAITFSVGGGAVITSCSSHFSSGIATCTVASSDIGVDDSTVTVTSSSSTYKGSSRTVKFKGVTLRIFNGSSDITDNTATVLPGELVSLTTKLSSGVNLTAASWSISGSGAIKNWVKSDPDPLRPGASKEYALTSTDTNNTSVSYCYTTPGSATVSVSGFVGAASTPSGSSTFTVGSIPSCTLTKTQQQAGLAGNNAVGLGNAILSFLSTGLHPSPPYGVDFTASGGSGGTLAMAQIVNSMSCTIVNSSGTTHNNVFVNIPGLDNAFPYNGDPFGTLNENDNPDVPYSGAQDINLSSETFTMYLMWKSNKSGSIPVKAASLSWNWNAHATFVSDGTGTLVSGSAAVSSPVTGSPVSGGTLNWDKTVANHI